MPLAAFDVDEAGISVLMSWDAGVEIIAPSANPGELTAFIESFLETKGESVFSAVYEVANLDAAVQRAVAAGAIVVYEELIEPELLAFRMGWPSDHQSFRVRQAVLIEYLGTTVCLQEARPA